MSQLVAVVAIIQHVFVVHHLTAVHVWIVCVCVSSSAIKMVKLMMNEQQMMKMQKSTIMCMMMTICGCCRIPVTNSRQYVCTGDGPLCLRAAIA